MLLFAFCLISLWLVGLVVVGFGCCRLVISLRVRDKQYLGSPRVQARRTPRLPRPARAAKSRPMSRVALIDYGSGNLHSCARALAAAAGAGHDIQITASPAGLAAADRIVLPGVGHFADCAGALRAIPGMTQALEETIADAALRARLHESFSALASHMRNQAEQA